MEQDVRSSSSSIARREGRKNAEAHEPQQIQVEILRIKGSEARRARARSGKEASSYGRRPRTRMSEYCGSGLEQPVAPGREATNRVQRGRASRLHARPRRRSRRAVAPRVRREAKLNSPLAKKRLTESAVSSHRRYELAADWTSATRGGPRRPSRTRLSRTRHLRSGLGQRPGRSPTRRSSRKLRRREARPDGLDRVRGRRPLRGAGNWERRGGALPVDGSSTSWRRTQARLTRRSVACTSLQGHAETQPRASTPRSAASGDPAKAGRHPRGVPDGRRRRAGSSVSRGRHAVGELLLRRRGRRKAESSR